MTHHDIRIKQCGTRDNRSFEKEILGLESIWVGKDKSKLSYEVR